MVLAAVADGLQHEGVIDELGHHLGEVDGSACGGGRTDVLEEPGHLLLADVLERLHPGVGEQLRHADLAELAPPLAVGCQRDVVAVEGESFERGVHVPVGEREVLRLQGLLRRLRRRQDQRRHLAKPEHHDWSVLVRQPAHCVVG